MGEGAHTFIELPHPPIPPALDICSDLACNPTSCHVDLFPQPLPPHSIYPMDCIVLCSFVLFSTLAVNKDRVVNRVDVVQPTCAIIHDKHVWESKEQSTLKDDYSPYTSSTPS